MKKLNLIISFSLLFKLISSYGSKTSELSIAFKDIANEIFTKLNSPFDIIFFGQPTQYSKSVIDNFLFRYNSDINVIYIQNGRHFINHSAIFVVNTVSDAIELYTNFKFEPWVPPYKFRFLLFVEVIKNQRELMKIPRVGITKRSNHFSHFSYYVIDTKKNVKLFTIDPFREGACGSYEYVEIGNYEKKLKKWNKFEVEEKFKNFHKCLIIFESYIISDPDADQKLYQENFVKILSEKGNFTHYVSYIRNEFENVEKKTHQPIVYLGFAPVVAADYDHLWVTSSFADISYIFYLTPAEKYSSYEKMVMPFDIETWIYLVITFGVAFGVIFVLRFIPKSFRKIIVGSRVQHPGHNILSAFFGIGQVCWFNK